MGIVKNNKCSFCLQYDETILHLFWDCDSVKQLLQDIRNELNNKNIQLEITCQTFILGHADKRMDQYNILEINKNTYSAANVRISNHIS